MKTPNRSGVSDKAAFRSHVSNRR